MKIDGGCHCGNITYEAEVDPEKAAICHCTDCQSLSGAAFRTVVISLLDAFTLLSGDPKMYAKTGAAAPSVYRPSVRTVARKFTRPLWVMDQKSTAFVSAPYASAMNCRPSGKFGIVQHRSGWPI